MEIDDTLLESGKAALGAVLEAVQRVRDGLASEENYDAEADLASIEASIGQCMSVLDGDAPEAVPAVEGGGELSAQDNQALTAIMNKLSAMDGEIKALRGQKAKESAEQVRAAKKKEADDVFNPLVASGQALAEDRIVFDAIVSARGLASARDYFAAQAKRSGLPAMEPAKGPAGAKGALTEGQPSDTPELTKRRSELDAEYKKHGVSDENQRKLYIDGALKREAEIEYERVN